MKKENFGEYEGSTDNDYVYGSENDYVAGSDNYYVAGSDNHFVDSKDCNFLARGSTNEKCVERCISSDLKNLFDNYVFIGNNVCT